MAIIRGSYRTLMQQLKHHPDLGGDTATAALINEAYAVLSNPDKRQNTMPSWISWRKSPSGVPTNGRPGSGWLQIELWILPGSAFSVQLRTNSARKKARRYLQQCGSPLAIAGNQRIESIGQRSILRIDKQQDITFYTQWPQSQRIHRPHRRHFAEWSAFRDRVMNFGRANA